jgi:hypothetical protein
MGKINEKDIVDEQLKYLHARRADVNLVVNFQFPKDAYDKTKQYYGKSNVMVREKNYEQRYCEIVDKEEYDILLEDDAIICFNYSYDKNKIVKASLSYIPSPFFEQLNFAKSRYLRIDYDPEAYKENVHSCAHAHFGVFENHVRIPVKHIFYPKDFLYFVLKFYYSTHELYKKDLDFINSLKENVKRRITLRNNESDSIVLQLGQQN